MLSLVFAVGFATFPCLGPGTCVLFSDLMASLIFVAAIIDASKFDRNVPTA